MAERKSAKAAAGSSAQTSSDLPLQGTHTQAQTHSQQLPSDRPLSALRSFLMQCLCSRIAIPPYSDLVCFFNYLSPPFRDTVTIFNRKDNCWFNYIYRMLNLKPHPTSLHRYSQASDKANSTLTFFSVANFAKCYLQRLCGEEHQRQKMKRMKDEMKEAVPALNLHTQLTSLKPN